MNIDEQHQEIEEQKKILEKQHQVLKAKLETENEESC
jgi:hypothetical protein